MVVEGGILVCGGYGEAGHRIAGKLARRFPDRVVVGGRNVERARQTAYRVGFGTKHVRVDVNDPISVHGAIGGIGLVINCVDQRKPYLLSAAIDGGLAYADITADAKFFRDALARDATAKKSGSRVVLGTGLAPGIINVMARSAVEQLRGADSIHTATLLSLGDEFGPEAVRYMLDASRKPYNVFDGGEHRRVRPLSGAEMMTFPEPIGIRKVYRFPFPDQFFYPRTLDATTSISRVALDPAWLTALFAAIASARLLSLLPRSGTGLSLERMFSPLQNLYGGKDHYAISVEASREARRARLGLVGHGESEATAIAASIFASALYEGTIDRRGVSLPEQALDPDWFLRELSKNNLEIVSLAA